MINEIVGPLSLEQRERAVDELLELGGAIDGLLAQQADLDIESLQRATRRTFADARAEIPRASRGYRWTFLVSGLSTPFARIVGELTEQGPRRHRGGRARARRLITRTKRPRERTESSPLLRRPWAVADGRLNGTDVAVTFGVPITTPWCAGVGEHVGVHDVGRCPGVKLNDLVEDVGELHLVFVERHVADVRRADDVLHRQQRMRWIAQRFLLEYIERSHAEDGPS